MECKRCGNKDPSYFYLGSKGYYCRKCIGFKRILLEEEPISVEYYVDPKAQEYHFAYQLTASQIEASHQVLTYIKQKEDVLLYCVTGAGKSEMVVETISYYLCLGKKVAYSIARKEVVKELTKRFQTIFNKADVVGVYGGHCQKLYGDLIVCTTHQLYRYYKSFDLLVIDEADAFPLKGNATLMNIALNSCKGNIIFSTATVDSQLEKVLDSRKVKTVALYVRPSKKKLIIPKIHYGFTYTNYIYLLYLLMKLPGQCLIFVTSKKECHYLYNFLHLLFDCKYVYADYEYRDEVIEKFRNNKFKYLLSTSLLERGITILGISVIILDNLKMFDCGNYVQMLGRVGRSMQTDPGQAFVLSCYKNKELDKAMAYLMEANKHG